MLRFQMYNHQLQSYKVFLFIMCKRLKQYMSIIIAELSDQFSLRPSINPPTKTLAGKNPPIQIVTHQIFNDLK